MLRLQILTALRPAVSSAGTVPQMAFGGHWRDALGKDPTNRAYSLANPSNVQHIPACSIDAVTAARIAVPLYSCDKESRLSRTNAIIVI